MGCVSPGHNLSYSDRQEAPYFLRANPVSDCGGNYGSLPKEISIRWQNEAMTMADANLT